MKEFLLILILAAPAAAQTQNPPPGIPEIATTGRGEVRVAPDKAILNVGIETRSGSANAAVGDNASRVLKTIASLRSAGVDSARITTGGYSLGPDYDKNKQIGFIARNNLRVEVLRITDVGKLIDAALSGGATQVYNIQFVRADSKEARRSALALAVEDARRDAEVLAQAAGGTLGKLISLTSNFSQQPMFATQLESAVLTGSGSGYPQTPMMPGDLTIAAIASARWQFVPRQ
ncbi:MAG: SIMPL domain-containing protein [Gemmatimonadaceae bacterium]